MMRDAVTAVFIMMPLMFGYIGVRFAFKGKWHYTALFVGTSAAMMVLLLMKSLDHK